MINVLNSPLVWDASRWALDLSMGLYRKRFEIVRRWNVITEGSSVLDVGCGTGHYSRLAQGRYLGIDLDERYIAFARSRYSRPMVEFRCANLAELSAETTRFDVVIAVDVLHHLSDELAINVLRACKRLASRYVVSFEPIQEQSNVFGRWLVANDRGEFIRSAPATAGLIKRASLDIVASEPVYLRPSRTIAMLCK